MSSPCAPGEERLVWYRALPARTKVALRNLGVLGDYAGYLVRDDYAGWHQFDKQVAGVQQCVAHLFRHLQGVLDLHPDHQAWAGTVRDVLRKAHTAVEAAKAARVEGLDPALLADFGRNPDPRKWSLTSNDESGRFTHTVDAPLRSASRADRVATASRSGSASLNIKPARVGSSTSARLSWSDASDVPGRQIGAEIGAEANGDVVKPLLFIG